MEVCWQLRFSLDTYIEEYEHLGEQMRKVEAKQKELSGEKRHAPAVEILQSHPAVGPVTAIAFRTEVFSPERFKTGHQVSKYLGLDPVVRQSGEGSAKTIGISRAGRPYVRGLLVQAAWRWIKVDKRAAEYFRRVTSNTGNSKKAIVALARKLAVVLWTILRNGELYRAA
jgi:transposase